LLSHIIIVRCSVLYISMCFLCFYIIWLYKSTCKYVIWILNTYGCLSVGQEVAICMLHERPVSVRGGCMLLSAILFAQIDLPVLEYFAFYFSVLISFHTQTIYTLTVESYTLLATHHIASLFVELNSSMLIIYTCMMIITLFAHSTPICVANLFSCYLLKCNDHRFLLLWQNRSVVEMNALVQESKVGIGEDRWNLCL